MKCFFLGLEAPTVEFFKKYCNESPPAPSLQQALSRRRTWEPRALQQMNLKEPACTLVFLVEIFGDPRKTSYKGSDMRPL